MDGYFDNVSIEEYLADRGSLSGSVLSMVEKRPEDFGRWLAGKDVGRDTAAMGRGSYFHARLLEPDEIAGRFTFAPNRHEFMVPKMVEEIGPRGGKKMVQDPSGATEPQDPDPSGVHKTILRNDPHGKRAWADFLRASAGLTIVYPEDQPKVEAMVRAVRAHPEAAALLAAVQPEMSGFWKCPESGVRLRIRPDGIIPADRIWIEIKSHEPRTGERLDTLDPRALMRWIREGWARKSAMLHDGCRVLSGQNWVGYWIIVEATEHEPRVSVVRDDCDADASLYALGRDGDGDEIRGYIELAKRARELAKAKDFRAECTRGVVEWRLPEFVLNRMRFAFESRGESRAHDDDGFVPPVLGATPLEAYDGQQ